MSWLVEAGGIKELQPKILKGPGGNESEGGGASKPMFQTTDEGEAALAEHDAMRLLCELVDASGPHRSVYMQLLDACTITRDTAYLSHLLENDFSLESSKLYPAFFIDKLEKAGGLSWDGGWNTTEDGRAFLASANETK